MSPEYGNEQNAKKCPSGEDDSVDVDEADNVDDDDDVGDDDDVDDLNDNQVWYCCSAGTLDWLLLRSGHLTQLDLSWYFTSWSSS